MWEVPGQSWEGSPRWYEKTDWAGWASHVEPGSKQCFSAVSTSAPASRLVLALSSCPDLWQWWTGMSNSNELFLPLSRFGQSLLQQQRKQTRSPEKRGFHLRRTAEQAWGSEPFSMPSPSVPVLASLSYWLEPVRWKKKIYPPFHLSCFWSVFCNGNRETV